MSDMSNREHIRRLNEKIEIVRIRRRCGYIVAAVAILAVAMLAMMWVDYQMMQQIMVQQEDGLDQLMEIRNSVDKMAETEEAPDVISLGEFEITHYCTCEACCGSHADGYTATGTAATPGRTVAADPAVIPYGTTILIGGSEYVVEDCGGAIRGQRIDILMESHEEALQAGRYRAEVSVKKEHQLVTADVL